MLTFKLITTLRLEKSCELFSGSCVNFRDNVTTIIRRNH